MKHQIEKILSFLDDEEIASGYMTVEEVVYGFYKDGEMEVRCFFLCGFPHKLMSYSICLEPIDMARREEIENNLLKINEDIHTGYFYIDMDHKRICYYNDLHTIPDTQTETTESKNSRLEQFCRWSYEAFLHYAKALYA